VPAHPDSPGQSAVKQVSVCVFLIVMEFGVEVNNDIVSYMMLL